MTEKTVNFINYAYRYPHDSSQSGYYERNSLEYYHVILKSVTVGEAAPKYKYIDVPYRNGKLDITDFFGDVTFDNRQIDMEFIIPWQYGGDYARQYYSQMASDIGGMKLKIVFASDDNWYYEGRCTVGSLSVSDGFFTFTITMDAFPFKMQDGKISGNSGTVLSQRMLSLIRVAGSGTLSSASITNTTLGTTMTSDFLNTGGRIGLSATPREIPDIYLTPGTNRISLSGGSGVTIYYRIGML